MTLLTPVFSTLQMKTHMPFFDGNNLLFCGSENVVQREVQNQGSIFGRMAAEGHLREHFATLPRTSRISHRNWKLFYCNWKDRQPARLFTGLPSDYIECSPAMYQHGGRIFVSFIGGAPVERGFQYHLYVMNGESLSSLSAAQTVLTHPTRVGFVNAKYVCSSDRKGISIVERATARRIRLHSSLRRIARLTYRADDVESLLITGFDATNTAKTILYQISSQKTQEIKADVPVYKSSISADLLVVATKSDTTIEPYRLVSSSYALVVSNETVSVV